MADLTLRDVLLAKLVCENKIVAALNEFQDATLMRAYLSARHDDEGPYTVEIWMSETTNAIEALRDRRRETGAGRSARVPYGQSLNRQPTDGSHMTAFVEYRQ